METEMYWNLARERLLAAASVWMSWDERNKIKRWEFNEIKKKILGKSMEVDLVHKDLAILC